MSSNYSVGAQRLRSAGSIAATARTLGVVPRTISAWRSGHSVPSPRFRATIAKKLKIEAAAWDTAAPETAAGVYAAAVQETLTALRAQQAEIAELLKSDRLTPRARFEYALVALRTARAILRLQRQPAKRVRRSADRGVTLALSAARYFARRADEIPSVNNSPSAATLAAAHTKEHE